MAIFITILISCSENSTDPKQEKDTENPEVSISLPTDSSSYLEGDIVTINVDANDDNAIDYTSIIIENEVIYNDSTPPYEYNWDSNNKNGYFSIYSKAYDKTGNVGISDKISIFVLEKRNISITEPSSLTKWTQGDQQVNIVWDHGNLGGNVIIELYKGFSIVDQIAFTENNGFFNLYNVSNIQEPGVDYRIKITHTGNTQRFAFSEYFEIKISQQFNISQPNSASSFTLGQPISIIWEALYLQGFVKLELWNSNTYITTISESTQNNGEFQFFTIPASISAGSTYKIKIISLEDNTKEAFSENFVIENYIINEYNFGFDILNGFGLTWDGSFLWSSLDTDYTINKHSNDANLTIIEQYSFTVTSGPVHMLNGITFKDSILYSINSNSRSIFKHNSDSVYSISQEYTLGNYMYEGIYWDGYYFWISVRNEDFILIKCDGDLNEIKRYSGPGELYWNYGNGRLFGITRVSNNYYLVSGNRIYKCGIDPHNIVIQNWRELPFDVNTDITYNGVDFFIGRKYPGAILKVKYF